MQNLLVCKMCLSMDAKLYKINGSPLQQMYEKLTDILFDASNGKPNTVCYVCVARLDNCCKLQALATRADKLLTQLLDSNMFMDESTLNLLKANAAPSLSAVALNGIDITVDDAGGVKYEQPDIKDTLLKQEEQEEESNDVPQYSDTDNETALSEDDLPLKTIKLTKSDGDKEKVPKRKHKTESLVNSVEIVLTHQQQVCELAERAKSLNYLNSPYKCDLCYKGFVHAQAYHNHKEKHSEASGALECAVCRLRYGSARQLRAHAASAHERRYVCNACQHRSHTKNQALVHERWHNGHTYPCKLCGQVFSRPTTYLTHARKAHASEHVCARCGRGFVGRHGLLMHASKAHRDHQEEESSEPSARRCEQCAIQFSSRDALARHLLHSVKHTPWDDDRPECRICGARVQPELRREHLRAHARALRPAPDAPRSAPLALLPCEQCGAAFPSRARLAAHVRATHLGLKYDRNVICETCGKKCTSHARLRYHQRRHTGARPHGCGACGARFAERGQLRLHARRHSGERPYGCGACGKRFSQKPALNRHYRVHTGAKPYSCQLCSKTFSQSNSVKLHVNSVHLKLTSHRKRKPTPTPDS